MGPKAIKYIPGFASPKCEVVGKRPREQLESERTDERHLFALAGEGSVGPSGLLYEPTDRLRIDEPVPDAFFW
jgi:hypothetical protein